MHQLQGIFARTSPECPECDSRTIEAFPNEYAALVQKTPLQCNHKKEISQITALGLGNQSDFAPPIKIPALHGTTSRQEATVPACSTSSVSTVTLPKLKRTKADLVKANEELTAAQSLLENALQDVEEGELQHQTFTLMLLWRVLRRSLRRISSRLT